MTVARQTGKRVEVASKRTETSTTWVNADGSLTTELSAGPIRFRKNSEWINVDVHLQRSADGSVRPVAHPDNLRLSGGSGKRPKSLTAAQQSPAQNLVTLGKGDQQITLQWHGGLPEPQIDGTRATYVGAIPDADVVVDATRTGFEQYVQIKKRPGSPTYSYTLPLKAEGLTARQLADGSVEFTDATNRKRSVMPAPVMWDAAVDTRSGEHTHTAKVGLKVIQKGSSIDLVVAPDPRFLADPGTIYPVTVDPSTSSLSNVFDTYVQQGETVDHSTDTELDLGNPGTSNPDGTPRSARSFITWNTAPLQDALILNAKLSLWNFYSTNNDCNAANWTVWETSAPSTSSRWTSQPSWIQQYASSNEARGNPACTAAGWINADVTGLVQKWASSKNTLSHMGLRAPSDSVSEWKRVNSANAAANPPKLVVNYNLRPQSGTKQEAGPPFLAYSGTWLVNTTTPTLRDTFVDPDGDNVEGSFQLYDAAANTQVGNVLVSPYAPSGQPASVQVPSGLLAAGKTYKFRTSPSDGTLSNTTWSAWTNFTVDTTAPAAPSKITSAVYPSGAWTANTGQDTVFTITPPGSDQNWIEWSLDDGTWTKVVTNGATADVNITVPALSNGSHTVRARAVDRADNRSAQISYAFGVGTAAITSPANASKSDGSPLSLHATSAPGLTKVRFRYRSGTGGTFTDLPATDVTRAGSTLTSWPVDTATDGSSPDLAWRIGKSLTTDGTYQIMAVFSDPSGTQLTSAPVTITLDRRTAPTPPTSLAVEPRDAALRVTWAAPSSEGGSAVTSYVVTVLQGSTAVGEPRTLSSDARSTALTELTNGTTYTVQVAAQNAIGTGAPATATAAPKAATAPDAPTNVTTAPGATGVTVTWETPTNDGGADLASTTVEIRRASDDSLVTTSSVPMPTRAASLTGLTADSTYYAVVYAFNSAGLEGAHATSGNFTSHPATLMGIGAWKTSDPATDAPMICILWHINGPNQNNISGQIHFQLTAEDGTNPSPSSDWAIAFAPDSNYLAGTDGEYAWCADAADIPRSTINTVWTAVSFTGEDEEGSSITLGAGAMKDMTIQDPDGNDVKPLFTNT
ncbi:fibronectin type III domain-containing protein [Streptomyces sp. NPDC057413]|uniref:fibronectin type III domain-containing protein n=1 Tax=Streptomyces sp. NPDC057413 TaxID=3346124 RepID=UPI003695B0F9